MICVFYGAVPLARGGAARLHRDWLGGSRLGSGLSIKNVTALCAAPRRSNWIAALHTSILPEAPEPPNSERGERQSGRECIERGVHKESWPTRAKGENAVEKYDSAVDRLMKRTSLLCK